MSTPRCCLDAFTVSLRFEVGRLEALAWQSLGGFRGMRVVLSIGDTGRISGLQGLRQPWSHPKTTGTRIAQAAKDGQQNTSLHSLARQAS